MNTYTRTRIASMAIVMHYDARDSQKYPNQAWRGGSVEIALMNDLSTDATLAC